MAGPRTAKQRGYWPEPVAIKRLEETVPVTFSMPRGLYDWFAGFVGRHNHFLNVEEALITAVTCIAGNDHEHGAGISSLLFSVAESKGISASDAFVHDASDQADRPSVVALLDAAFLAAEFWPVVPAFIMPRDPKHHELVRQLLTVVGVSVEENQEADGIEPDDPATARTVQEKIGRLYQMDDDIPF